MPVRLFVVLVAAAPLLLVSVGVAVHVLALNDVGAATTEVEEELVEEVLPISEAARTLDEVRTQLRSATSLGDELAAPDRASLIRAAAEAEDAIQTLLDGAALSEERDAIEDALEVVAAAPDLWLDAAPDEIEGGLDRAVETLKTAERVAIVDAAEEARASTTATVDAARRGLALAAIGVVGMLLGGFATVAGIARPLRRLTAHVRSGGAAAQQYRAVPSALEEIRELREALAELSSKVEGARAELERQATTDPLTGLANRAAFTERLDCGDVAAIALIDLDGFKLVNDTHGHADGDRVLVEVARRLVTVARPQDLVVRLGGDEFAVVIDGDPVRMGQLATRSVALLAQPIDLGDRLLSIGASAGWAACSEDPTDVVRRADLALFAAKEASGNQALAYAPWMSERARQLEERERELRAALRSDHVQVELDPIVHLGTGRLAGYEVLVHCHREDGQPAVGCRFEAELEVHGLADQLVLLVLDEVAALLDAEDVATAESAPFYAVNVPSSLLTSVSGFAPVADRLLAADLRPARLVLEIPSLGLTEAPEGVIAELRRLRGTGVRVTADEAGEGAAILPHLHRLPIDALKPAVSIFRDVMSDQRRVAAVAAVAELVAAYGLELMAAGVDDPAVVAVLLERGIALGQGPGVSPAGSTSPVGAAER